MNMNIYETSIRHADERLYRRKDSRSYLRNQTVAKNPEKKKSRLEIILQLASRF